MVVAGDLAGRKMRRDNWLSVLIGPFKFVVPTLAYILLYPLMISETSIEIVGLWSLVSALATFVSVTDIGFSQLLTRDAGLDRSQDLSNVHADYLAAQRFYMFLSVVLVFVFLTAREYILAPVAGIYSLPAMTVSITLILAGAMLQVTGKLDAAILSARHNNYIVQMVTAVAPVLTYSSAIIGTLLKKPIEGLAVGTVLSAMATVAVYRFCLSRYHNEWTAASSVLSLRESVTRLQSLTRRGWYLYSCSVGMMLRGPIYRLVIVSTVGLQAAAVFDISMRMTQTLREVVATGFSVLFPSFALLSRHGERTKTVELIQVSLMALLSLGALFLGLLIGVIVPLLSLWLGDFPSELVSSTRILAIWQIITLANVPFWYLLQATHNERIAAYSIWAHTAAIILAIPLSSVFDFAVIDLMVYWTATSVLTQGLIYYYVQARLKLLWESILNPRILTLLVVVVAYAAMSYLASFYVSDIRSLGGYLALATTPFISVSALIVMGPLFEFVRSGGNAPVKRGGLRI
jgi:O-antigen/teichoic acid export membrane protein